MAIKTKTARSQEMDSNPTPELAGSEAVFWAHRSAWTRRHATSEERRPAPGAPGSEPRWARAAKTGVGTALSPAAYSTSLVWFTLSQGIITEMFYPRVDRACTRDLGLIVTDGESFFSDERTDADHRVEHLIDGVPIYRLVNTCRQGRYRVEKLIFAHPHQDAVLQVTRFAALNGKSDAFRLYALLAPHLANKGEGNTAWLGEHQGVPMLFAHREDHALALACSAPWKTGSAGYVGVSDGWQDLSRNKRLTQEYDRADNGNVALTGEIDLGGRGGAFVLAVGFGAGPAEAGHRALSSLLDDPSKLQDIYVRGWQDWQKTLSVPQPEGGREGRELFRISASVIQTHTGASIPGAIIASLSTPWGEIRSDGAKTDGIGGYHLVWPRDMVESATGLLAAGARSEAIRALDYLQATQMSDGHWPQNFWVTSAGYWSGIQLGETALPLLLLDLLRREGALPANEVRRYWPMVRRAIAYIIRSGPSTQQDRWENQRGYTPFTLATVIAAMLIAADMADEQGESGVASYVRETADTWNTAVESWLYVTDTELARRVGVEGYYVRSIPPELDEATSPRHYRLKRKATATTSGGFEITEVVSPDALALVRFGLRSPDDPRIVATARVIDTLLKVDTPVGPVWRRYNGDLYGEGDDGSPEAACDRKGTGRGWPLLTGERAHYELALGRRDEALRLLHTFESFAGDGGMLPEQVWDSGDIPERGLFLGRPTGSAMPLAWAHAEYLKLRRSIDDGRVFDTPPQTVQRYVKENVVSDRAIWRFDHARSAIAPGDVLRVELKAPARIRWTFDDWKTTREDETRDTGLGLYFADLDTKALAHGSAITLTFYWPKAQRWEGKDYSVHVE